MARQTSFSRPPARRWVAAAAGAIALGLLSGASATTTHEIVDRIDRDNYFHYMWDLLFTHPGHDRGFGPEHDLAFANIIDEFESFGLDVTLHPFLYDDDTYHNVVAVLPGTVFPDQQYIVGAHFDSVDNPGADDNGSGTAAVMEIARVLSEYEFERTIIFIAFDREEQGLIGSTAYAEEHANDDIRGMVAMDMVAHDVGDYTVLFRSRSETLAASLADAVAEYGRGLNSRYFGPGDYSNHAPFEWGGFEAGQIREELGNPFYHTQNDNIERPGYLDFDYAANVTRSICGWLVDHAVLVESSCVNDLDGSGMVDFGDIVAILAAWGSPGGPEDLDGSGTVDFGDLVVVLGAWGPCE